METASLFRDLRNRDRSSRRSREMKAFFIVPWVAATMWYLLILSGLAIANGQLRWRTDVVTLAVGAVIVGVPAAAAITIVVAIPVYLLVRSAVGISLGSAAVAGGAIGLGAAFVFWRLTHEWTLLSPLRGPLIGVTTAAIWWYVATRQVVEAPHRGEP